MELLDVDLRRVVSTDLEPDAIINLPGWIERPIDAPPFSRGRLT